MRGATHYTQLTVWKLADELRVCVFDMTRRPGVSMDFARRRQLEDAIDSVCRNIAEGFGYKSDRTFAHYLQIARASLNEVTDAIRSAMLRGHISAAEAEAARQLASRLYPALARFITYLRRSTLRTDRRKR